MDRKEQSYPLNNIAGPLAFFEACKDEKQLFMDAEVFRQILELLINQERKESDPQARASIRSVIDQMAQPVRDAELTGADGDAVYNFGGVVFIGENVRRKMIDAISSKEILETYPHFVGLLQGPGTNELSRINTRSAKPRVNDYTGEGKISTETLTAFISGYKTKSVEFRPSTWKLLDICAVLLNDKTNYRSKNDDLLPTQVKISLDEYAKLCGKPNTKSAKDELRKQVKADLDALFSVEIEWTEQAGKGRKKDYAKMRIITSHGVKNGEIFVGFSPEMKEYLNNSYIMQYPLALLKVDDRNPNTYTIGRKLALHNSIDNNRRKGTANIISVAALLEACAFTIPSYEEVISETRHVAQQIIAPLEKSLDALAAANIIRWEYSNSKGEPLTDQQVKAFDYSAFSMAYIHFEMIDAPERALPEPKEKPKRGRPIKKK